jgi:hypothetical protein
VYDTGYRDKKQQVGKESGIGSYTYIPTDESKTSFYATQFYSLPEAVSASSLRSYKCITDTISCKPDPAITIDAQSTNITGHSSTFSTAMAETLDTTKYISWDYSKTAPFNITLTKPDKTKSVLPYYMPDGLKLPVARLI